MERVPGGQAGAGLLREGGRGELRTVQALRAAACLLVVAYHAIDAWGAGLVPPRPADAIWPNGAAGVDLFFVISGFVMALSSAGLSGSAGAWHFLRRRIRRVVPLYWTMTLGKLALLLAVPGVAAAPTLWHMAASFLFIPSRDEFGAVRPLLGVGWTLQFEMLFYGVVGLALLARARKLLAWVPPVLLPLAVAGYFRRADWPAPASLANGLVLEFCLGLAVAAWLGGRARAEPEPAVALALSCGGAILLLALPEPGPWRFLAWGLPAAAILAGAVMLEKPAGRFLPAWLLAIGDASFAIYLFHPFVVPLVSRVLARFTVHLAPGFALPVLIVASLAASIAGGLALHRWIDRPLQAVLARRGRPQASAALNLSRKPAFGSRVSAEPMPEFVQS